MQRSAKASHVDGHQFEASGHTNVWLLGSCRREKHCSKGLERHTGVKTASPLPLLCSSDGHVSLTINITRASNVAWNLENRNQQLLSDETSGQIKRVWL